MDFRLGNDSKEGIEPILDYARKHTDNYFSEANSELKRGYFSSVLDTEMGFVRILEDSEFIFNGADDLLKTLSKDPLQYCEEEEEEEEEEEGIWMLSRVRLWNEGFGSTRKLPVVEEDASFVKKCAYGAINSDGEGGIYTTTFGSDLDASVCRSRVLVLDTAIAGRDGARKLYKIGARDSFAPKVTGNFLGDFFLQNCANRSHMTQREREDGRGTDIILNLDPFVLTFSYDKKANTWSLALRLMPQWGEPDEFPFYDRLKKGISKVEGRPMKLAKLLRALDIPDQIILNLCTHLSPSKKTEYELLITDKYIPEIYQWLKINKNLSSCMAYPHTEYDLPSYEHPMLAYEECPELRLMLCYDKSKKTIAARAIGCPDDRIIFRSYSVGGYSNVFRGFGLRKAEAEDGEYRIRYIESDHGSFLMPYFDTCDNSADLVGGWLVLNEDGCYHGCHETGRPTCWEDEEAYFCEHCEHTHRGDSVEVVTHNGVEFWCEGCVDNDAVLGTGSDYVARADATQLHNGDYTLEDCIFSDYLDGHILEEDAELLELEFKSGAEVEVWILSEDSEEVTDYYIECFGPLARHEDEE